MSHERQVLTLMNTLSRGWVNRALIYSWLILIATLIVMSGISFASPPMAIDNSVFAYVGKGILVGEIPYLDRWDHKGPLTYLIYALGFLAPGWWGMWVINMGFTLGAAWLLFKIVWREFGVTATLFSVATLLVYARTLGLGEGFVEQYALLFQILALFLFLSNDRGDRLNARICLALGALGALSFLLRANLIGVWLSIGIYWVIRWRETRAEIAWSVIGGLSVLVAASLAFGLLCEIM